MAILEVNDLKQYFYIDPGLLARTLGRKQTSVIKAVDGLTFSLEAGEILGLAGESGEIGETEHLGSEHQSERGERERARDRRAVETP